jgi:hypothetical protein
MKLYALPGNDVLLYVALLFFLGEAIVQLIVYLKRLHVKVYLHIINKWSPPL